MSILQKLTVYISAAFALFFVVVAGASMYLQLNSGFEQFSREYENLGHFLSNSLEADLYNLDIKRIRNKLRRFKKSYASEQLYLLDQEGAVLVNLSADDVKRGESPKIDYFGLALNQSKETRIFSSEDSISILMPIKANKEVLGFLWVKASFEERREFIIQSTLQHILTILGLFLLTIGAIFYISIKDLSTTLLLVEKFVERIGKGEYSSRIVLPKGHKEVSDLAININKMVDTLEKNTVSMDFLNNIFDSISEILFIVNKDFVVIQVSEFTAETLGYPATEIIGSNIHFYFD